MSPDAYGLRVIRARRALVRRRRIAGVPIAYKLSHGKDNPPARMSVTADHDVDERADPQHLRVARPSIAVDGADDDVGSSLELRDRITAAAQIYRRCSTRMAATRRLE